MQVSIFLGSTLDEIVILKGLACLFQNRPRVSSDQECGCVMRCQHKDFQYNISPLAGQNPGAGTGLCP